MRYIIDSDKSKIQKEPNFKLFKHKGLLCCIKRTPSNGALNGYVAITKNHILFGKNYNEKIQFKEDVIFNGNYIGLFCADKKETEQNIFPLSLGIEVHGGLTYSRAELEGIGKTIFSELWWFGFDTSHAGDLKPIQMEDLESFRDDEYRDFEYVENEVKKLAKQLNELK